MLSNASVPILGFIAPSGTGKTTLLKALVSLFKENNIRLGVIKHSHHDFEIDKPGKDSHELRMAGADQMLIASKYRWALISESHGDDMDVDLNTLLKNLDQTQLDLILVEGFKYEHFPKIEIFRAGHNQTPLALSDPDVIAVVTDARDAFDDKIPCLDLNDIEQIFKFILQHFALPTKRFK
jgi:molybdopterin-guanine dinucleotide biosynthesis protein B